MRVLSDKWVKIRKPHHCWGCMTKIPVGIKMNEIASVDGGKVTSTYWCLTCEDFIKTDEQAREDNRDGWGFEYGDLINNYENYPKKLVEGENA